MDVESVTRCRSSPSLAVPCLTRKVPPVPLPRRYSAAQERQRVNNCQNHVNCTKTSDVSGNADLCAGVKSYSCHDVRSASTTTDYHDHENNNVQDNKCGSFVTDGSLSVDVTPSTDTAALTDGTVKDSVSDSMIPAIPARHKRHLQKELPEDIGSLDLDKISGKPAVCIRHMESLSDSESSTVQQRKKLFPQPKPRYSLLLGSNNLPSNKTEQASGTLLHSADRELTVEDDLVTRFNSTCPGAESDMDAAGIMSRPIASNGVKVEENEDGESFCYRKPHESMSDNISSAKSEQRQSEVENNVSAVKQNSSVLIPSRPAPPPPLPKPKVVKHQTGSFEVIHPCSDCNGFDNATLSEGDHSHNRVAVGVHSSLVSESGNKAISERNVRNAESDMDAAGIMSRPIANNGVEVGVTEKDGQSFCFEKPHENTNVNISLAELEQRQLEVENNVSTVKRNSAVVPSRPAPLPPLPKPKVVKRQSGAFEVVHPCSDCNDFDNATVSEGDSSHNHLIDGVRSSLVSESGDKAISERNLQQLVDNIGVSSSDSARPRSPESDGSGVLCHSSPSIAAPSVVISTSTPVAVSSPTNVEQTGKNDSCEVTSPVPAVRLKRKSRLGSSLGISSSAEFRGRERGAKHASSRAAATKSWSEYSLHDEDSLARLNLVTTDAVDQSSLKVPVSQTHNVPLRHVSLCKTGGRQAATDSKTNSYPSWSTSTESSCVSPSSCAQSQVSCEVFMTDTPPITPSAFRFDASDEGARTVCLITLLCFLYFTLLNYIEH